jgi:hypothetical protein
MKSQEPQSEPRTLPDTDAGSAVQQTVAGAMASLGFAHTFRSDLLTTAEWMAILREGEREDEEPEAVSEKAGG